MTAARSSSTTSFSCSAIGRTLTQAWLAELALETDARGYVVVDGNMETSCRGVFAVGDVANPMHPCIATAIATGTMAARQIQTLLARGSAPLLQHPPGHGVELLEHRRVARLAAR